MVIRHKMLGGCWVTKAGKKWIQTLRSMNQKQALFQSPWAKKPSSSPGPQGRVQASDTVIMGVGSESLLTVKSSTKYGSKTFYTLEARLKVTLHFKF